MDEAGFEVEAEGESGAGAGDAVGHLPVLMDAVMRLLAPAAGERVVDCTLGRGGHAEALLRAVGASGGLTGFDLDGGNLA
ncbi:MAG: 16S rRNA (cytosine(1402)-N(4))-methyltransferase, partial [Planctomycetota bacterium]